MFRAPWKPQANGDISAQTLGYWQFCDFNKLSSLVAHLVQRLVCGEEVHEC